MQQHGDLRIIIGASSQNYPGWIKTQASELDLMERSDWEARFRSGGVDRMLAEHVWEHLDRREADIAAETCFEFLQPGGSFRVAVPDGLFPNEEYQRTMQVGGSGPADHPASSHKAVYDSRTLPPVFEMAGFDVRLLEWWDEYGDFHAESWDERAGFIYRSARFDHRNQNSKYGFTSLILDAIKSGR